MSKQTRPMVGQTFLSALTLSFFLLTSPARAADEKPADVRLQPIFNGKDLTGWTAKKGGTGAVDPEAEKSWKAIDGVLVGQNDDRMKGSMLYTEKQFKDVVVEADVRWSGEIDSGIMIRARPELQVQIGVSRSLKKDMTGSVYYKGYPGQAKGVDKVLKPNDWNRLRIEARGNVFKVWLNGQHVLTWESAEFPNAGPIGVQIHGGLTMKVEFKNFKAAEL